MKRTLIALVLMHTTLFGFDIEVKVDNIENQKGKMYIGLFNKAKGFREVSKTFKQTSMQIDAKSLHYTFRDLPQGTYAISVFHDENNNGALDTNLIGIPKENYGFSNNIRHLMRATSFDEAKFVLKKNTQLTINVGE